MVATQPKSSTKPAKTTSAHATDKPNLELLCYQEYLYLFTNDQPALSRLDARKEKETGLRRKINEVKDMLIEGGKDTLYWRCRREYNQKVKPAMDMVMQRARQRQRQLAEPESEPEEADSKSDLEIEDDDRDTDTEGGQSSQVKVDAKLLEELRDKIKELEKNVNGSGSGSDLELLCYQEYLYLLTNDEPALSKLNARKEKETGLKKKVKEAKDALIMGKETLYWRCQREYNLKEKVKPAIVIQRARELPEESDSESDFDDEDDDGEAEGGQSIQVKVDAKLLGELKDKIKELEKELKPGRSA